ncbi:multicopper oxidase domain-containing protein [Methylomonas methanica]|uniref:multicopper oxidase domain-containing protein n=1 Tax=Methylomonas methanica TaxID=421 RepID=UPI00030177A3
MIDGGRNLIDRHRTPVKAWKDSVAFLPCDTVTVRAKFSLYKGKFVYHCHILEH